MIETEFCQVCQKSVNSTLMEHHHYIPRSKGGTINDTIRLCVTCHDLLHYYVPIESIFKYKSPEDIRAIPEFFIYLEWIKTKNHGRWSLRKVVHKISKLSLAS